MWERSEKIGFRTVFNILGPLVNLGTPSMQLLSVYDEYLTAPSLGQYIYAKDKDSIYIHQFISSEAGTKLQGGSINVEMESELLQNGGVFIRVEAQRDAKLKIRIPRYAGDYAIQSRVLHNRSTVQQKKAAAGGDFRIEYRRRR